jgi:hypothetical protein
MKNLVDLFSVRGREAWFVETRYPHNNGSALENKSVDAAELFE